MLLRFRILFASQPLSAWLFGCVFLYSCIFLYTGAALYAQSYTIVFSKYSITVAEGLQAIETQTPLRLAYLQADMPLKAERQLPQLRISLPELLQLLIKNEPLSYTRSGEQLVFTRTASPRRYLLEGQLREANTGAPIEGAWLYVPELDRGVVSSSDGTYRLSLPAGKHSLYIRHLSYLTERDTIHLQSDLFRRYILFPQVSVLPALSVSYDSIDLRLQSPRLGHTRIGTSTSFYMLPYYLGEVDVLQRLLLLPGVYSIGRGTSALSVRAGTPDQNRILLDGATLLNATHMFGLISVFNPDMIQSIDVYKGNYPPDYSSSASSSLIRVTQRSGNKQHYRGVLSLGMASGRITVEGPISKEKSSFIASARTSSLLGRSFFNKAFSVGLPSSQADFFDFNLRLDHHFSSRHRLSLSGYFGRDTGRFNNYFVNNWSNAAFSLQNNYNFGRKSALEVQLAAWRYQHRSEDIGTAISYRSDNTVTAHQLKIRMLHYLRPSLQMEVGLSSSRTGTLSGDTHKVLPGSIIEDVQNDLLNNKTTGLENHLFLYMEKDFPSLALTAGAMLRLNNFLTLGPYRLAQYRSGAPFLPENLVNEINYQPNELISSFYALEPHLFLNYMLSKRTSLRINYARIHQHLHQIYNTQVPSPASLWRITNPYIRPLRTEQLSIGANTYLQQTGLQISLELYNKITKNLYEYQSSLSPLLQNHLESRLTNYRLWSQGVELSLQGNWPRLQFWLSYTVAQSIQALASTDAPNYPQTFYSDYDHRHNFALAGTYHLSKRLYLSSNFVFATGRPYTLPTGQYRFEGVLVPYFEQRNQARLPLYHRLDLSCTLIERTKSQHRKRKKLHSSWNFTLYNAYGRNNVQSIVYRQNPQNTQLQPTEIFSLRSVFPSVSYRLTF